MYTKNGMLEKIEGLFKDKIKDKNEESIKKLVNVENTENQNVRPLHIAAEKGFLEIVTLLVTNEAEIDAKDKYSQTPLHFASFYGHIKVVKYLVEKGANINLKHDDSNTPLHEAALGGNIEVVKYLVEKGAKVEAKNKNGESAKDLAQDEEIKKFLESPLKKNEDVKNKPLVDSLSTALMLLKAKLLQLASSLQNK
jgi:ankyrin repeat protein